MVSKITQLFLLCWCFLIAAVRSEIFTPIQNFANQIEVAELKAPLQISHMQTEAVTAFSGTDSHVLFAVLNGTNCATTLSYGPSPIDLNGQVGGPNRAYLSTNTSHKDLLHTEWLQIVTSDGVNEWFRIYWSFATPRTLEDHFTTAVSVGELVTYQFIWNIYSYSTAFHSGEWDFSLTGGDMAAKFATTVTTTGFTGLDAQWGSGPLSGFKSRRNMYGVGVTASSGDAYGCSQVARNGYYDRFPQTKTYMYYFNSSGPSTVSLFVFQRVDGVTYDMYSSNSHEYHRALKATIVASINGITIDDLVKLEVWFTWIDHPRAIRTNARGDSLYIQYNIMTHINNRTNLYESMSSDISQAVLSGAFSSRLNAQGVPAAPSGYIEIFPTNTVPPRPPKKKIIFTVAVIVGISIGCCLGAALLLRCFAPCFCKKVMFHCVSPDDDVEYGEVSRNSNRNNRTGSDPYFFSSLSRRVTALREPEPVPTRAVLVAQLSASSYQEVAVADVQMVGAQEEECKMVGAEDEDARSDVEV